METRAKVTQIIDENLVKVSVVRQSACSSDCHKCKGCSSADFTAEVIVKNHINAKLNDIVVVKSDASHILKGAGFLYILPIIMFFIVYFVFQNVNSLVAGLLGFLAFAFSIYFVAIKTKNMKTQENLEIIDIIKG